MALPDNIVETIIVCPRTPSQWYFMSLISVSVFGVYSSNTNKQINYVYSKRTAGKGSNEVVSMLHHFARNTRLYCVSTWTIYADNCVGLNKNNTVLTFLLFLVHSKWLKQAKLKFFIKGHTKNNCDRGFGNIRRKYARVNVWTLDELAALIDESAETNECEQIENWSHFKNFTDAFARMYKDFVGITKYHIFEMDSEKPGVVVYKNLPGSTPREMNLLLPNTKTTLSEEDVTNVWQSFTPSKRKQPNPEKICHRYKNLRKFLPKEHLDDPLYKPPSNSDIERAQKVKKARSELRATLAANAEADITTEQATGTTTEQANERITERMSSPVDDEHEDNSDSDDQSMILTEEKTN
ncbi:TPA: LOW QUALITY PROTEIN: hypothetical protein N0F65_001688 [Lagenidium giganteum]|uniref:DUF7869 domain-containing protein n=1 Tax=Lagenidium giganteum TaxID=4803 RepID=A0AAV2Z279_9STRA|nr:TPA: LOW QUALITY PROTEIN: hypothetical protein N0F65_001688 [Lagenidium giganteum]